MKNREQYIIRASFSRERMNYLKADASHHADMSMMTLAGLSLTIRAKFPRRIYRPRADRFGRWQKNRGRPIVGHAKIIAITFTFLDLTN
jgi:hypothetical protein